MERLIGACDAQIVKLCYFNPVGALGWSTNSLTSHRSLNSDAVNKQIELFDKYLVPISRSLDPLTRRFFGQSVTCVVRRV
jgi:hypothetical protein